MQLLLIHSAWGYTEPFVTGMPRMRELGYSGIEVNWIRPTPERKDDLRRALDATGLRVIPQCFTCAWDQGRSVDEHLVSFRKQIEDALCWNPLLINFHSGSDTWPLRDMVRFYRGCREIERDIGVPVVHETHRGRCLYSPWITRDVLGEVDDLRLTVDFSHWVCVAERLLDDHLPVIALAAQHAYHMHARVGFRGGPQVADPRDPHVAEELAAHERWWDCCWDAMEARGLSHITMMPEFGPYPYMHHVPFTHQPIADQWDINRWMGQRQAARFAQRRGLSASAS